MSGKTRIMKHDWLARGRELFGDDTGEWTFVCPLCKQKTKLKEWAERGEKGMAAYSCIGRLLEKSRDAFGDGPGPCDYAGGGLLWLNPIIVVEEDGSEHEVFAFAENGA